VINNLSIKLRISLFVPDIFGIASGGTNLDAFFYEEAFGLRDETITFSGFQ